MMIWLLACCKKFVRQHYDVRHSFLTFDMCIIVQESMKGTSYIILDISIIGKAAGWYFGIFGVLVPILMAIEPVSLSTMISWEWYQVRIKWWLCVWKINKTWSIDLASLRFCSFELWYNDFSSVYLLHRFFFCINPIISWMTPLTRPMWRTYLVKHLFTAISICHNVGPFLNLPSGWWAKTQALWNKLCFAT